MTQSSRIKVHSVTLAELESSVRSHFNQLWELGRVFSVVCDAERVAVMMSNETYSLLVEAEKNSRAPAMTSQSQSRKGLRKKWDA